MKNRVAWGLVGVIGAVVLVGVGFLGVRLRPYWTAKYRGEGAALQGAILFGANLPCANLHRANLRGACLCSADLRGAILAHADLRSADLRRGWHVDVSVKLNS